MKKNCFDLLYQYFTKNAKCSETNHYGVPIYYCSQNNCNKGYICSQCLTEDPEHFSNHVKHFITLDTRKNFFKFLEIPIDNIEESFTSNFIINSRNKLFNKDKINDVNSFYEYIKNQIIYAVNNTQKNNLIRNENLLSDYYNTKKGIKNKNNEYINNKIKEFIKKDDRHKIISLMNDIKPYLDKKDNKITEKDKLKSINNIINEEIPKVIEKCLNILCHIDSIEENNYNEINLNNNKSNIEVIDSKEENNDNSDKKSEEKKISMNMNNEQVINEKENNDEKEKDNIKNVDSNKMKGNKIINIINDINPIKNDINILNIELNNNNNNIIDNHKSFYEGSINNISSIKTESNYETEEFESKININMNMNNININKNNINKSPSPRSKKNILIRHPSVNDDPFFNNNKELSIIDKENEKKNNINKIPFNNYFGLKKKRKIIKKFKRFKYK